MAVNPTPFSSINLTNHKDDKLTQIQNISTTVSNNIDVVVDSFDNAITLSSTGDLNSINQYGNVTFKTNVFASPIKMVINDSDDIYVINSSACTKVSKTNVKTVITTALSGASNLTINEINEVFITQTNSPYIVKILTNDSVLLNFALVATGGTSVEVGGVSGYLGTSNGDFYSVVNNTSYRIQRTGLGNISNMAIKFTTENIFIASGNTIQKLTYPDFALDTKFTFPSTVIRMKAARDSSLYALTDNELYLFNNNGSALKLADTISGARGMALDSNGYFIIAGSGSTIQKILPPSLHRTTTTDVNGKIILSNTVEGNEMLLNKRDHLNLTMSEFNETNTTKKAYPSVLGVNKAFTSFASGLLNSGIVDPTVETVKLVAVNSTTLGCTDLQSGFYFSELKTTPFTVNGAIKTFKNIPNYSLSGLSSVGITGQGFTTTGIGFAFVGLDKFGTFKFFETKRELDFNTAVVGLGYIGVSRTSGGTISFIDMVTRNVYNIPEFANISEYQRTKDVITTTCALMPSATTTSFKITSGIVNGMGINWTGSGTTSPHTKTITGSTGVSQFFLIDKNIINTISLPAPLTSVPTTQYYNLSTSAVTTMPNNTAAVYKVVMSLNGVIFIQYGEYADAAALPGSLLQAQAQAEITQFSEIMPGGVYVTLGFLAYIKSGTNFDGLSQGLFIPKNAGAGGSSSVASVLPATSVSLGTIRLAGDIGGGVPDANTPVVNGIMGTPIGGINGVVWMTAGVPRAATTNEVVNKSALDAKVANALTPAFIDIAPSQVAVNTALATKFDKSGGTVTGNITATSYIKSGGLGTEFLMANGSTTTDANFLHKTGDETFSGTKNSNVSSVPALTITQSGTTAGIIIANTTSAGTGLIVNNNATGLGVNINNNGGGDGYRVSNNNVGIGLTVYNDSTGIAMRLDNSTAATGKLLSFTKNVIEQAYVTDAGTIFGRTFIKSGGTPSQFLMADGSVSTLNTFNTITGSGITNQVAKFSSTTGLSSSIIYDNGTNIGVGTTAPAARLDVDNGAGLSALTSYLTKGFHDVNFRLGFRNGAGNSTNSEQGALVFDYVGSGTKAKIGFERGTGADCNGITFNLLNEKMRLDVNGNLGIGTPSPRNTAGFANLTLSNTDGGSLHFRINDITEIGGLVGGIGGVTLRTLTTGTTLIFSINNNEVSRFSSNGNLLLNTPTDNGVDKLQVNGSANFVNKVKTSMIVANGTLDSFVSNTGALYGYYSSGGVLGSYSDNSGTQSPLTLDGSSFNFRTNGSSKISVLNNGNVGIGSTSPLELIHVKSTGSTGIIIDRASTVNSGRLYFNTASAYNWSVGIRGTRTDFSIFNEANSIEPITCTISGNTLFNTTTDDGINKVQIAGTAKISSGNNNAKLHIKTTGAVDFANDGTLLISKQPTATGEGSELRFQFDAGNRAYATSIRSVAENYGSTDAGTLQFLTQTAIGNLAPKMVIRGNGNVLIGTTTDNTIKLQVINSGSSLVASFGGGSASPSLVTLGTTAGGSLPLIQGYNNSFSAVTSLGLNTSGGNVLIGSTIDDGINKLQITGNTYVSNNIGIGAPNPLARLTIGNLTNGTGEPTYHGEIKLTASVPATTNSNGGLEFKLDAGSNGYGKRILGAFDGTSNYDLHFQHRGASPTWSTNFMIKSNGNVLIGTTTDTITNKLQVNGRIYSTDGTIINGSNSSGGTTYMQFANNGTNIGIIGSDGAIFAGSGSDFGSYVYGLGEYFMATNSTKRIRINSAGLVAIGSHTPLQKLDVNGAIATNANRIFLGSNATDTSHSIIYDGTLDGVAYQGFAGHLWKTGSIAGIERMRLNSSGNLLIGTTADTGYKLSVVGHIKGSGIIYGDTLTADNGIEWGISLNHNGDADLNDLISGGVYALDSTTANVPPVSGEFSIQIERLPSTSNVTQRATNINTGRIFTRERVSSVWTAWKEIVTTLTDVTITATSFTINANNTRYICTNTGSTIATVSSGVTGNIEVLRYGTGSVSFSAGTGTTLRYSSFSAPSISEQYATVAIQKLVSAGELRIFGELTTI